MSTHTVRRHTEPRPSPERAQATAGPGGSAEMDALLPRVRACTLCAASLPLGPRPVLQAHAESRILIAGQAPGRKVHLSGVPFDDVSGDRLRAWLGVSREQFYDARQVAILPMGFCYPGTGASGDLPPRPECAPAWRAPLLAAMPQVQLVLVLGQYALAWHWPRPQGGAAPSVTEAVMAWRRHWPQMLPLPHPSPRNNRWFKQQPWFEEQVVPVLQARVAEILAD